MSCVNPDVRIENPLGQFRDETTMKRAERLVRAGRAVFVAPLVIRFVDKAAQVAMARDAELRLHARITGAGYDSVDRLLDEREMLKLPLIAPQKMLRMEGSSRAFSFSAAVRRTGSVADVNHGDRAGCKGVTPREDRRPLPKPMTDRPAHELAGILTPR